MKKIKLEQIAEYLAHGLKCHCSDLYVEENGKINFLTVEIVGLGEYVTIHEIGRTVTEEYDYSKIKPILFPIESIFQEVDFYGEKVNVWEKILDLVRDYPSLYDDSQSILFGKDIINHCNFDLLPHTFIKLFQKYHIDYQGLISQGKAINKLEL